MPDKLDAMTLIHGEFWYSGNIQGCNSIRPVIMRRCPRHQLHPASDIFTYAGGASMSSGSIAGSAQFGKALMLVSKGRSKLAVT